MKDEFDWIGLYQFWVAYPFSLFLLYLNIAFKTTDPLNKLFLNNKCSLNNGCDMLVKNFLIHIPIYNYWMWITKNSVWYVTPWETPDSIIWDFVQFCGKFVMLQKVNGKCLKLGQEIWRIVCELHWEWHYLRMIKGHREGWYGFRPLK